MYLFLNCIFEFYMHGQYQYPHHQAYATTCYVLTYWLMMIAERNNSLVKIVIKCVSAYFYVEHNINN